MAVFSKLVGLKFGLLIASVRSVHASDNTFFCAVASVSTMLFVEAMSSLLVRLDK